MYTISGPDQDSLQSGTLEKKVALIKGPSLSSIMGHSVQNSVGSPVFNTFSLTASFVTLPRTTTFLLARSMSTCSTPVHVRSNYSHSAFMLW